MNKPRASFSQDYAIGNDTLNLLDKTKDLNFASFNEEKKQKLIFDLKTITLKNWTNKTYSEVINIKGFCIN